MRYTLVLIAATTALMVSACGTGVSVPNNDSAALVAAIRSANAGGNPEITLARHGLYVLTQAAEAGLALPSVTGKLRINGNGAEIRSYAGGATALMQIGPAGDVTLRNLSLAEGSDGAVRNFGKLHLESTQVVDSTATSLSAIILNHGKLIARDSEFAYNEIATSPRDAGTVLNYGELQLDNTRIHDNRVNSTHSASLAAGAVLNLGLLRMTRTVMADNIAEDLLARSAQDRYLRFAGVMNLGNGRIEGPSPAGAVRDVATTAYGAGRF